MTDFTPRQLVEIILRSLKETARDVDERRVPLDGRVRLLPPEIAGANSLAAADNVTDAAE